MKVPKKPVVSITELVQQVTQNAGVDMTALPPLTETITKLNMSKAAKAAVWELITFGKNAKVDLAKAFAQFNDYEFERLSNEVYLPGFIQYLKDKVAEAKRAKTLYDETVICQFVPVAAGDYDAIQKYDLVKVRKNHELRFTNTPEAADTYSWLTRSFLLTDFYDGETNRVVELCRDFRRDELAGLLDGFKPEERSISLLYARAQDMRAKREGLRAKERIEEEAGARRFAATVVELMKAEKEAVPLPQTDWIAKAEERAAERRAAVVEPSVAEISRAWDRAVSASADGNVRFDLRHLMIPDPHDYKALYSIGKDEKLMAPLPPEVQAMMGKGWKPSK